MIYKYMGKQWGPDENKWPSRIENLDIMLNTGRQGDSITWKSTRRTSRRTAGRMPR